MYINGMWLTEPEIEAKLKQITAENKLLKEAIKTQKKSNSNVVKENIQPVKHGHWYHNTSKYVSELDAYFIQACCSCCGKYSDRVDSYSQQMSNECCSHCGARMDGEQND